MPIIVDSYPANRYGGNQVSLPHPIFVSSTPADGDTDVDLMPLVMRWVQHYGVWYSVDTAEFAFNDVPADAFTLSSGVYEATGDPGDLFPEVTLLYYLRSKTTGGYAALSKLTFDTRVGIGYGIGTLGDLTDHGQAPLGGLAEFSEAMQAVGASVGDVEVTGAVAMAAAAFANLNPNISYSIADNRVEMLVSNKGLSAEDLAKARFSYALAFLLISMNTLNSAAPSKGETITAETVEGYVQSEGGRNSERIGGKSAFVPAQQTENISRVMEDGIGTQEALTTGTPTLEEAIDAVDTIHGEGKIVLADVCSTELELAREE